VYSKVTVPDPWQTLSSQTVFDSRWFRVRKDVVRLPSGLELDDYYVIEQPTFVKICACTGQGDLIFVREYKHGIGRSVLQLPGGLVDAGEGPREAAERELREETGYAGELRPVGGWMHDPTRSATIEHVFFGRASYVGEQQLDRSEDIEVVLIPARDVRVLIDRGEIAVMSTVGPVLYCLPLILGDASLDS
jgi:8-oxo-dGTP pyrophosphatase MutT (NUDIX family)